MCPDVSMQGVVLAQLVSHLQHLLAHVVDQLHRSNRQRGREVRVQLSGAALSGATHRVAALLSSSSAGGGVQTSEDMGW